MKVETAGGAEDQDATAEPQRGWRVEVVCITMVGSDYWLAPSGAFPAGELRDGESPAVAARRVVHEATATDSPKLELVDMRTDGGTMRLIFRALLTSDPKEGGARHKRMELPERVGMLSGKDVEEMLRTSLAYKLTRH